MHILDDVKTPWNSRRASEILESLSGRLLWCVVRIGLCFVRFISWGNQTWYKGSMVVLAANQLGRETNDVGIDLSRSQDTESMIPTQAQDIWKHENTYMFWIACYSTFYTSICCVYWYAWFAAALWRHIFDRTTFCVDTKIIKFWECFQVGRAVGQKLFLKSHFYDF